MPKPRKKPRSAKVLLYILTPQRHELFNSWLLESSSVGRAELHHDELFFGIDVVLVRSTIYKLIMLTQQHRMVLYFATLLLLQGVFLTTFAKFI